MDAAGLTVLLKEMEADCIVAADASEKAAIRLRQDSPGHLEACAYELARFYNVLEKIFERICEAFENHLEKRGDYHERLIQRMTLDLDTIRPAFVPKDRLSDIRELKGFRHIARHAYDLTLRADRLGELARIAQDVGKELPAWCVEFRERVRAQEGWRSS
jgi:hypothetical protein